MLGGDTIAKMAWRLIVPHFSTLNLSFNAAYKQAVSLGFSYRRTEMLTVWNDLNGLVKGWYRARDVNPSAKFPINRMIEGDLNTDYKYRVFGYANYHNSETGERWGSVISQYTDRWLSLDAYKDIYEGGDWTETSVPEIRRTSLDWQVVKHNSGFTY